MTQLAQSTVDDSKRGEGEVSNRKRAQAALDAFHEEARLGKAYDARLMWRLWPFLKPHSGWLLLALSVVLLTAATSLARPLIMLETINEGVVAGDPETLFVGGLTFGLVVLIEQILSFAQIYALQIVGARAMADLRRQVFRFLQGLPNAFFDRQPVGRLVTRVTNDVDGILELFASGALNAVGDLIRLVGIVILMLALDPKLSLIGFAAAPFIGVLVWRVRRRSREAFREIRAKTARMNATMNEQVAGMSVVQALGRERAAAAEFDDVNQAYRDANIRAIKYEAIQDAAVEAVEAIALASIVVALGYHAVSFGVVVAFAAYLRQFFEPIAALAQRYTLLQSAMAGAERVFGLLDVEERDAPEAAAGPEGDPSLAFEFDSVDFEYKPEVPVLEQVSFAVRCGQRVAIVGPTGSGKTTITSLLLRLYDVRRGVVRVLGRDVRSLGAQQLRRSFAVVPQDVFLFTGTLAENVAAGEAPDMERVERCLRNLGAYDLFCQRPEGLLTRVEERGANFSQGERQLIAFARALYRDADVLVLDEATANIDSDTESRIQRALEVLLQGRTALIIAHRLSTIQQADTIVVLRQGRVVETGSHEELLAEDGLYASLYRLQLARLEGASSPQEVTATNLPSSPLA